MFLLHNVTAHRVTIDLHPATAAPDGAPSWAARRFARQNTFHPVVEAHQTLDLMKFGLTEKQCLAQPEVLSYMRKGYLRRVKETGGGFVVNQYGVEPVAPVAPVEPQVPVAYGVQPEPEPEAEVVFTEAEIETAVEGRASSLEVDSAATTGVVRTPFRPAKKRK